MFKKMTAALVALTAAATIFTSCAPGSTDPVQNANGDYVPKKDLKITVWNTQGTDYTAKELKKNIVEDWLVDKTKVKVENIYGNDGGQWDAKLSKLVAANDLPAIVSCGAYQGPAHFSKLDEMGKLWELTPEMIQQYAPEVWRKTPAKFWEEMTVNGKILGIPYLADASKESIPDATPEELKRIEDLYIVYNNDVTISGAQTLWVRDDILKRFYPEAKTYDELCTLLEEKQQPIGEDLLDIPIDSTEKYIKFMYDIKDANLKENGKTVYAFGYCGSDNWSALAWLGADMYGYKGHNYTGTWNDTKQEIEIPLVHDVIRQAAKEQNQMLADKVIDPESMAHTVAQANEKVLNGLYAIVPMSGIGDAVAINKTLEENGKPYRYRPFYTQVPAQKDYAPFREETLWNESLCILKTVSEEELHQILNWINVQYTDEYDAIQYWGPEDAGLYETDANGIRHFTDERFTKYFIEGDSSALTPEETLGVGGPEAAGYKRGGLFSVGPANGSKWEPKVHTNYIKYNPSPWTGFKFPAESEHVKNVKLYPPCQVWSSVYAEIPEVVTFWAERGQWENSFKMAMAASVDDFDSKWDAAIDSLNKIVDVKTMETEMTKVAKGLLD